MGLLDKIKTFKFPAVGEFFGRFYKKLSESLKFVQIKRKPEGKKPRKKLQIIERAQAFLGKASSLPVKIAAGAFALTLLVCAIVLIAGKRPKREAVEFFGPIRIEEDDLFWPPEPDFLPPVQLEREPRKVWTDEDSLPYWTDPEKEYGLLWRERLGQRVDEIMERVP